MRARREAVRSLLGSVACGPATPPATVRQLAPVVGRVVEGGRQGVAVGIACAPADGDGLTASDACAGARSEELHGRGVAASCDASQSPSLRDDLDGVQRLREQVRGRIREQHVGGHEHRGRPVADRFLHPHRGLGDDTPHGVAEDEPIGAVGWPDVRLASLRADSRHDDAVAFDIPDDRQDGARRRCGSPHRKRPGPELLELPQPVECASVVDEREPGVIVGVVVGAVRHVSRRPNSRLSTPWCRRFRLRSPSRRS